MLELLEIRYEDFVFFLGKRINLVSQKITHAFLRPLKGRAGTQISP